MFEILFYISLILIFGLIYLLYINQLKVEQLQEYTEDILNFLGVLSDTVSKVDQQLVQIDHKGHFKSDDEVGFFFNYIKSVQETIQDLVSRIQL